MNRQNETLEVALSAMLLAFVAVMCMLAFAIAFLIGFAVGKFVVAPVMLYLILGWGA